MNELSGDERVRAFTFDGGEVGCLLLHGFTGTPAEMRPLGERLASRGYAVRAPLLPGHGTRVEDLARTRWTDWFAAAEASWRELGEVASKRVVAGLSMGSLLALHLAHEHAGETLAVAALAPALELANQRSAEVSRWIRNLPRLTRRFEIVPKKSSPNGAERLTPAYDEIPLRALASMLDLQRRVRSELCEIRTPALLAEGGRDQTVAARSVAAVEAGLGSIRKTRLLFPRSGHILTEDVEQEAVLDAVERFFAAETTSAT
jgi:carboxylesterase